MRVVTATARTSTLLLSRGENLARHLHRRSSARLQTSQFKLVVRSSADSRRWRQTSSTAALANVVNTKGGSSDWTTWNALTAVPGACLLLAAGALLSPSSPPAEAGWWPFSGGVWRGKQSLSPFDGLVPRRAVRQREKAEVEMRAYLEKMRVPVQALIAALREGKVTREEFDNRMASFNDEVELTSHRIIFGATDPPDARRRYVAEHGNCRYTPKAIETVAALSPLIEIGASRGHWQRALSSAGATVVAFDEWVGGSSYLSAEFAPVGNVLSGDERALRLHRDKTLLLVYPPPGEMALRCLREYTGEVLVYVGEGRRGANACNGFFDRLDAEWEVTSVLELDPFPQCLERLFVLRRKAVTAASGDGQVVEGNLGARQEAAA